MRFKSMIISVVIFTFCGGNAFAQNATTSLKVNIEGIENHQGQILGTLCKKEEFLKTKCEYSSMLKLGANQENILVFENVVLGEYALQVFHDINGDFKLKTNIMGIPTEPFAFSNNAKAMFGPPKFEQAAFDVKPASVISISFEQ